MSKVNLFNTNRIHPSWKSFIKKEMARDYFKDLSKFLESQHNLKKVIYPKPENYFKALELAVEDIKVVILGQDPYHGPDQAHGLSFSVPMGVKIPPSLRNIYKELNSDLNFEIPEHGNLNDWAERGVLLLNATLSVEAGKAGSHQKKGWEEFTDQIISYLNENRKNVVYMLWGSYAQKKGSQIDRANNLVLESPHPSPLSAHRGFLGNRHFSSANKYLKANGLDALNWELN